MRVVALPAVPYGATAVRPDWNDLPPAVRAAINGRLGAPVATATSAGGGFTRAFAGLLRTTAGLSAFVKAAPLTDPEAEWYAREAAITAALPAGVPAPRLRWTLTEAGWFVLCLDPIDGHVPSLPWSRADLSAALTAWSRAAVALTHPPAIPAPIPPRDPDLALDSDLVQDPHPTPHHAAQPATPVEPSAHPDPLRDLGVVVGDKNDLPLEPPTTTPRSRVERAWEDEAWEDETREDETREDETPTGEARAEGARAEGADGTRADGARAGRARAGRARADGAWMGLPLLPDLIREHLSWWSAVVDGRAGMPGWVPGWVPERLPELAALERDLLPLAAGSGMLHGDLRVDNVLIDRDGSAWICDWTWPCLGAPWFDTVTLLVSAYASGLDVEPHLRDAPARGVSGVLAAMGGYWLTQASGTPAGASPHSRQHHLFSGTQAMTWLAEREGW